MVVDIIKTTSLTRKRRFVSNSTAISTVPKRHNIVSRILVCRHYRICNISVMISSIIVLLAINNALYKFQINNTRIVVTSAFLIPNTYQSRHHKKRYQNPFGVVLPIEPEPKQQQKSSQQQQQQNRLSDISLYETASNKYDDDNRREQSRQRKQQQQRKSIESDDNNNNPINGSNDNDAVKNSKRRIDDVNSKEDLDYTDASYDYYEKRSITRQRNYERNRIDDDDDDDDDDYLNDRFYEEDDNDEDDYYYNENRYDDKVNSNNNDIDERYNNNPNQIYWEQCTTRDSGTAYVLLPPPDVTMPSCIIHFIGGTFLGSTPSTWYRSLLEEIVLHTNAAIIATSIPVTIFTSPLQHIDIANRCYKQFTTAYKTIILDEYSYTSKNRKGDGLDGRNSIESVPICGMGHSLGARLLTVLTTLYPSKTSGGRLQNLEKRQQVLPPPYKSFILISFTNYGAASGIPGIFQLSQQSKQLQQEQLLDNAVRIGQEKEKQRQQRLRKKKQLERKRRNERRMYDNDYDYDEDYDDDDDNDASSLVNGVITELQDLVRQSTLSIKSLLTPSVDQLEFYPTPKQLWDAITVDKRYQIQQTLVVQFDNDLIDQSSKLASELIQLNSIPHQQQGGSSSRTTESTEKNATTTTFANDSTSPPGLDVRFARLRGNHLTPVSIIGPNESNQRIRLSNNSNSGSSSSSSSSSQRQIAATDQLLQALLSTTTLSNNVGTKKDSIEQQQIKQNQFLELRQTIARYITDVVTKEMATTGN